MKAHRTGPSTMEITIGQNTILYSYDTPVAYRDNSTGKIYRTDTYFSKTTSKHINQWIDNATSDTIPHNDIVNLIK